MNTEQERAAFEDCFKSLGVGPYQPHNNMYVADEIQARWEAWQARAALQSQVKNDRTLFCDLKTDEEKSAFFLSGRGYETGVIAQAIQNDVAMAYHRCAEYKKELEALQSQDREDAADMFWDADDTEDCLYACDEEDAVKQMVEKVWPTDFPLHFTLQRAVRLPDLNIKVISMSDCGTDIQYEREAIDHARRVEEAK